MCVRDTEPSFTAFVILNSKRCHRKGNKKRRLSVLVGLTILEIFLVFWNSTAASMSFVYWSAAVFQNFKLAQVLNSVSTNGNQLSVQVVRLMQRNSVNFRMRQTRP